MIHIKRRLKNILLHIFIICKNVWYADAGRSEDSPADGSQPDADVTTEAEAVIEPEAEPESEPKAEAESVAQPQETEAESESITKTKVGGAFTRSESPKNEEAK